MTKFREITQRDLMITPAKKLSEQDTGPRLTIDKRAWLRLEASLAEILKMYYPIAFTIQFESDKWDVSPYIQTEYFEDDDTFVIEVTSNRYLRPALDEHQEQQLRFKGWCPPDSEENPNYYKIFQNTEENCKEAARMWVEAIRDIFQITYKTFFRVAPHNLPVIGYLKESLFPLPVMGTYASFDWRAARRQAHEREAIKKQMMRPIQPKWEENLNAPKFRKLLQDLGPMTEFEMFSRWTETNNDGVTALERNMSRYILLVLSNDKAAVFFEDGRLLNFARKLSGAITDFHPGVNRDFKTEILRAFSNEGEIKRIDADSYAGLNFEERIDLIKTRNLDKMFPQGVCYFVKEMMD